MQRVLTTSLFLCSILCSIMWSAISTPVFAKNITYMGLSNEHDAYYAALLTEIFNVTDKGSYQVKRYEKNLPHNRSFHFLAEQREIDIVVGYATKEREQKYLSVPIPLMKGLNGWRLSAVHKDNSNLFRNITSLDDFKRFTPGQYHASGDFKILLANDVKPAQGSDFNGMYYMLDKKRIDYFPRSIAEIDRELAIFVGDDHQLNIVAEPHILITYPTALYFYVNKQNTALAEKITLGFEQLIQSGQFNQIFDLYYGDMIEKIRRQNRQVFELENPFLPSSVPLERKELWL